MSALSDLFKNLTVLEVANVLAGPAVGMFFAELGARVIKVENPRTRGDTTRQWKLSAESSDTDVSGYFSSVNWGKRSIGVAFDKSEGREVMCDLVRNSDMVIQSFKVGDDRRFGLDYDSLKAVKESIIYAHITAYGPDDERTGFDAIIQAESGFTSMNGTPESGPIKMPVALIDLLLGHQLKEALLLGLLERQQTGKGTYITLSLIQSAIASLANQASNYLVGKTVPRPSGSDHPNITPYGTVFRTKDDKDIVLGVGTDSQFRSLCEVLGIGHAADDIRFKTNRDRVANKSDVKNLIGARIAEFLRNDLLETLLLKRIPAGAVRDLDEVFQLPEAQDLMLGYQHGIRGVRTTIFESDSVETRRQLSPPPGYNEHGSEILRNMLGYTEEYIRDLRTTGAVE